MANSCIMTLTGIPYACEANLSGCKNLWMTDWNNVTEVTVDGSTNTISDVSIEADASGFVKYTFAKNTGALTKTLTKDEATGTKYFTNEFTCNFNRMDAAKRLELNTIAAGQIAAIVEDLNGMYWYLGKDNYAIASIVSGQTGAASGDGNYYSLTIQDISADLPYTLDASVVTALKL